MCFLLRTYPEFENSFKNKYAVVGCFSRGTTCDLIIAKRLEVYVLPDAGLSRAIPVALNKAMYGNSRLINLCARSPEILLHALRNDSLHSSSCENPPAAAYP